jgi:hypothetical protein
MHYSEISSKPDALRQRLDLFGVSLKSCAERNWMPSSERQPEAKLRYILVQRAMNWVS